MATIPSGCTTITLVRTVDGDALPAIGSGRYRYQMTLVDSDGNPLPHTDFALGLRKRSLPFITAEKNVWQGRTDAEGLCCVTS